MTNLQEKKAEAIKRMKLLGIAQIDIDRFIESIHSVAVSLPDDSNENTLFFLKMYNEFYKKYPEHLLYYMLMDDGHISGYRSVSFLFVEKYTEDWEFVDKTISMSRISSDGIIYKNLPAYVYNLEVPDYSETGFIFVTNLDGILYRVG